MSDEWTEEAYAEHEAEVMRWVEYRAPVLIAALDGVIQDSSAQPRPQPGRPPNWSKLVLHKLSDGPASWEELLQLIENRGRKGGFRASDILAGTLNQMDDDGLIRLQRSLGVAWYHLTARGNKLMKGAA
jgi:hypothetical protein